MFQLYSKKVLDHFHHPRNMGEIKNPNGMATVGNVVCGDVMRMYIKIARRKSQKSKRKEGYIKDIKFQTLGCGAAIATSSMVTEMVKGKSLEEALKVSNKTVTEALGGLPAHKIHCSVLAAQALRKAIEDYRNKYSRIEIFKEKK